MHLFHSFVYCWIFLLGDRISAFISPQQHAKFQNGREISLFAKSKKTSLVSVKQLVEEVVKKSNRNAFTNQQQGDNKKSKRTRKRVETPKQQYVYASHKKVLERTGSASIKNAKSKTSDNNKESDVQPILDENSPITIARNLGMNPSMQACEASFAVVAEGTDGKGALNQILTVEEPRILESIRLATEENDGISAMFAYVIEKPAGWSVLENNKKKKKSQKSENDTREDLTDNAPGKVNTKKTTYYDEENDAFNVIEYNPLDILSVMTPEEIEEFEREGGFKAMNLSDIGAQTAKRAIDAMSKYDQEEDIEAAIENVSGNLNYDEDDDNVNVGESAIFSTESRPSLVKWLKDLKSNEGTPIRGGKFWTAVAGAVEIDDSGLLLLCPKDKTDQIHIDYATYVAVIGNGKYLAPKGKKKTSQMGKVASYNDAKIDVMAKLKKGRDEDTVVTAKISIPDGASISNDIVQLCQKEFLDGIRGDPEANPLDRRAPRRLIHCRSLAVSSLSYDDAVQAEIEIPDDIRIYSDRRNQHQYTSGSFLGRNHLQEQPFTTAYREINGEADGFPGWIVDRYDKWLLVQHNEDYEKGPLPSLHDGNTLGVYYFPTERDRSVTGGKKGIKPVLLEGKLAPDLIPIKENGITYLVNFEELSTGIFLDQRNQRAWLSRFCTENTKVLNCFSHCGAFSIAAASAGAKTVSLDLDKKWLDRIEPQLRANGIDNSDRKHDTIYGDCFDWLRRLQKRGEKFDIVILDPPSTSVGGKKKSRWSAKNDYDELVSLAAPLVKRNGLLWTTTNSRQIHPVTFARMCKKGLVDAGISSASLERVAAMPGDFPTIGPQAVKNLVWRIHGKD